MPRRRIASLVCLGLALFPACSLSRSVAGVGRTPDAAPSDSGVALRDAGPGTDANVPPRDAWIEPGADAFVGEDASIAPIDAFVEPPDAFTPMPDAFVVGPRTCGDIYGAADGYDACPSMPGQCSFEATLYVIYSCGDVCEARGGSCIDAFAGTPADACMSGSGYGCGGRGRVSATCICTHVP